MFEKLENLEKRYQELEVILADTKIISDKNQYQKLAKELSDITPQVLKFREFKKISKEIDELESVLKEKHDSDFIALVHSELKQLQERQTKLKQELERILMVKTTGDEDKEIIVEIRAGTGGQEASIFAADLYRMYSKYAIKNNWKMESMDSHPTELGGFKEIVFSVKGKDAYKKLKFESGVHRIQRVPATEASGRIHTSTATVAVLAEPKEIELVIDPKDLKIDTYRSSGPGGQHMQKSDSAVRITHIPTSMVVACQDERSQLKNKNKAMRVLRARLLDKMRQEETSKFSEERKSQVGSGDRSEKIRTYNFPDHRVTDHRVGVTLHKLDSVMDGDLGEFIDALLSNEAQIYGTK